MMMNCAVQVYEALVVFLSSEDDEATGVGGTQPHRRLQSEVEYVAAQADRKRDLRIHNLMMQTSTS